MPDTMDFPNEAMLQKIFVQEYIKQKYDEEAIFESLCRKQSTNALSVLWYQEAYIDIETENDTAMSAPIDTALKRPAYRASGGLFAMTDYSHVEEKNAGLYQLGLQGAVTEEAVKYTSMEEPILRMQRKLGRSMASEVNRIVGNTLSEDWSASPTNINDVDVASGEEWSLDPTTSAVDPISDIIDAIEAIEDNSGYNYKADTILMPKQTYFDVRKWAYVNDYEFGYADFRGETKVDTIEGLKVVVSNHIKRDYTLVMDAKEACVIFEAQPLTTDTFFEPTTREYYFQVMRTFYPALTDPKAVSSISNTVA